MIKYFKITNRLEIHNNLVFHDGLNILKEKFDDTNMNSMSNGIYFTTIDYIPKYYYIGINLREIILPKDSDFKMIRLSEGDKYRANKVIFGKKYSLYNPETYTRFGLNMEYNIHLVNHASTYGDIDFLNLWKKNAWNLKYSTDAIDLASQNGHVFILEWWKNSSLRLKYTKYAIDWACGMGNLSVLEWWFNSGLKLKYSQNSILFAIKNKHKHIIDWLENNIVTNKICMNDIPLYSNDIKMDIESVYLPIYNNFKYILSQNDAKILDHLTNLIKKYFFYNLMDTLDFDDVLFLIYWFFILIFALYNFFY